MERKINFFKLALTSALCLLPIILSVIVYNDLPDRVAMHWQLDGSVTWYGHKAIAAFGMPLFFMLLNIISTIAMHKGPRQQNSPNVVRIIGEWTAPVVSIIFVPVLLFMGLGVNVPVLTIVPAFVGVLLIIVGNYLPKTKQNWIMGVRVPWTLNDSEIWNKTHRLAGYLWILLGVVFIATAFLQNIAPIPLLLTLLLSVIAFTVFVPILYSYILHKRKNHD